MDEKRGTCRSGGACLSPPFGFQVWILLPDVVIIKDSIVWYDIKQGLLVVRLTASLLKGDDLAVFRKLAEVVGQQVPAVLDSFGGGGVNVVGRVPHVRWGKFVIRFAIVVRDVRWSLCDSQFQC